ncbi:MAG: TPM domain-containing protein [Bacteroidia bacterium]
MRLFKRAPCAFFTDEEGRQIVAAIREAEQHSSGEIRVHLEARCKAATPFERARAVFARLNMHKTELRNGVLLYLAVEDHRFALFADQGINQAVPSGYWDEVVADMQAAFREARFAEGLAEGIRRIGQQLKTYFPRQDDDINELSDDISYG